MRASKGDQLSKNPGCTNFSSGVCAGYVNGVNDGLFFAAVQQARTAADVKMPYCIPHKVNIDEMSAVFVKYLNANPEKWHKPAATLLIDALSRAFPCKK
jgi:hypothetical protein